MTDHLVDVFHVYIGRTECAANHRIGIVVANHHAADQRAAATHFEPCIILRHPLTRSQFVILLPIRMITFVVIGIDQFKINARFEAQAKALQTLLNHRRTSNDNRTGDFFVDHHLYRAQHALVFTFGKHHASFATFAHVFLSQIEYRLHEGATVINKMLERIRIRTHIVNRAQCHAAVHCGLRDSGGNFDDQTRIKRLGNQIFTTKAKVLNTIRRSHHIGLLLSCQTCHSTNRCDLHLARDRGRADIQCTTENKRKTQNVIHLIGVIGTPRGDDRIRANFFDQLGQNLGGRIGEYKHQRIFRHFCHHFLRHHAGG